MNGKRFLLSLFFLGLFLLILPWSMAAQEKPPRKNRSMSSRSTTSSPRPLPNSSASPSTEALKDEAECLVIQMDTPGGLDLSMRDIIKDMMNADIPIVVYVAPSGARAASAGVLITLAADIAAMAPGTNIGAAHPVAMGGPDGPDHGGESGQ